MMNKKTQIKGKIRTEWFVLFFIIILGTGLILHFINILINSSLVNSIADVLIRIPIVVVGIGLFVFLIASPFIRKWIIREMKKEGNK